MNLTLVVKLMINVLIQVVIANHVNVMLHLQNVLIVQLEMDLVHVKV